MHDLGSEASCTRAVTLEPRSRDTSSGDPVGEDDSSDACFGVASRVGFHGMHGIAKTGWPDQFPAFESFEKASKQTQGTFSAFQKLLKAACCILRGPFRGGRPTFSNEKAIS